MSIQKKHLFDVSIHGTRKTLALYITSDTGKVITRKKIDTIMGVPHPGIIIGSDTYGRMWVAHNHYKNDRPMFDTLEVYADGEECIYDLRQVNYSPIEVAMRAYREVEKSKLYNAFSYNCQTFVNLVVQDKKKSETIDTAIDVALWGSLGIATLSENKKVAERALNVALVSGIAKLLSKL